MDRRLIQPKQKDYLIDKEGNVSPDRFEWLLYLQIPNKLNGQLYFPTVIKFRSLQQETDFLDYFEHVLPIQSKGRAKVNDLLAVIIGNGTNYGLYGMANISDRAYDQLKGIQANYLRPETLNNANDVINNAIAKQPIFTHYNIQEDVIHASADRRKFESRLDTFKTLKTAVLPLVMIVFYVRNGLQEQVRHSCITLAYPQEFCSAADILSKAPYSYSS